MKAAAALAVTFVAATSASAQVTGMDCSPLGGRMQCSESAMSQAERMNRENMDRLHQSMNDDWTSAADMEVLRRRSLQKKVAKLVKAGKCDEAKAKALDAGDLDVADQAVRLCTPAAPAN